MMNVEWSFDPESLRALREFKGMSPEALGRLIGKSRVCILNWEKGRGCPTLRDACAIAEALAIDPRRFFVKRQPVAVGD